MVDLKFTRKDLFVAFVCVVFLLATMGAISSSGRRRAKEAVCASNLKRWGAIFQTFVLDNDGKFPRRGGMIGWVSTIEENYPATLDEKLYICPMAPKTWVEGGRNPYMAWPANNSGNEFRCGYVINLWVSDELGNGGLHQGSKQAFWRTPYVRGAAKAPLLSDGQTGNIQCYAFDAPSEYESDVWTPGPQNEMSRACISRHNGGVNAVFLDGSVRKIGLKYLWKTNWHRIWEKELAQSGFPSWPAWMANFKDPE